MIVLESGCKPVIAPMLRPPFPQPCSTAQQPRRYNLRRTIFKQDQLAGVVLEMGGAGEDNVELVAMGFFQEIFCADGGVSGEPVVGG